jgi:transposase
MLGDISQAKHVYIACGYTDLRKSIDGLAIVVGHHFELDPFERSVFLFCGRRCDRLKALYWEGDGFVLLYKRLERGRYQWPRSPEEARKVTQQQFRWLLEGLSVEQPKALKQIGGLHLT